MSVEDVAMWLGEDRNLVTIEEVGDYVKVKFRQYVDKAVFTRVLTKLKDHGGEYVSGLGKNSHFRIPKNIRQGVPKSEGLPRSDLEALLRQIAELLRKAGY